ncbi:MULTISPECIES: NmrA/HSCARG family protein [Actinoalloteichus]|uniref:NmrA-like domain-containing protein n=1 Tax=Actinoalloteichus fjordicus TaxID=1612552 RepID=A0AAC9LB22_9PSEU|nr:MULTISPECIES: NmrA/HSCARG family protein [Actinoalloteichus]APU13150.1 hypothetical protein UA74_05370 [Actinoalloteichus fjordicus]APU19100.1 hypothetical protein UA75_05370 [Actinoalloteichus sp. GBA129-24]
MSDSSFVLVTGATGQQGGAAARALLQAGQQVHALVRDPAAPKARALADSGAILTTGDLTDPASLLSALDGARGVFSVQVPDFTDPLGDREVRHARNLAEAAAQAGVEQIVHTSVSGTGTREPFDVERWGAFVRHYWGSKASAEQAVRNAALRHTTILRPGTFMENFVYPSFYYPEGRPDRLLLAFDPEVPLPFVAVADIGNAAATAFTEPERFDGVELELAGELLSPRTAAAILSDVLGRPVTLSADPAEAAEGLPDELVRSQQYTSEVGVPAHPDLARALGLSTTSFADWAKAAF